MAFNHYAKIKRILETEPDGWYIMRINEPTEAKNFKGETISYDHYYRVYSAVGEPIRYCKFQKIDKCAHMYGMNVEDLPIIDSIN